MGLTRRHILGAFGSAALLGFGGITPLRAEEVEPKVGDDGLYHEDWFIESFLDLKDDLAEASAAGKHFAVLWEQRGCPYCREMHRVNFARPEIRDYVRDNFNILQLDMWGPRKVTDFDGKEMGERELAQRWGVTFSPTINFFPAEPESVEGKNGRDAEIFRMPGYFKPFHFISVFEYVRSDKFDEAPFQRFLQDKTERLREAGKTVEMWD